MDRQESLGLLREVGVRRRLECQRTLRSSIPTACGAARGAGAIPGDLTQIVDDATRDRTREIVVGVELTCLATRAPAARDLERLFCCGCGKGPEDVGQHRHRGPEGAPAPARPRSGSVSRSADAPGRGAAARAAAAATRRPPTAAGRAGEDA
jgi:hypothetical protein